MAATTKDIAAMTGFSLSTVTKVVRGRSRQYHINPETERRIMAAAAELNYRPNLAARSLITRKTQTVGLLFYSLADRSHAYRINEIQSYLRQLGYAGLVANWPQGETEFAEACDTLLDRGVDGIICCHYDVSLFSGRTPVVLLSHANENFDSIHYNYTGIMTQARDYLHGLGHRRIGFAGPRLNERSCQAFREVFGTDDELLYTAVGPGGSLASLQSTDQFFRLGPAAAEYFLGLERRPSAIVCNNDSTAMHLISAAMSHGWRVPEELSVIGMGNLPESALFYPALTTFDSQIVATARRLVDILFERMDDPDLPVRDIVMEWPLVVRSSCAPAPAPSS